MKKACLVCNKAFNKEKNCSLKSWDKRRFCSHACYWRYLVGKTPINRRSYKGQTSPNKGKQFPEMWGEKHPRWKGGRVKLNNGYIRISVNGKTFLEHRYVMETELGRKLERWETVHHKDGDKENNNLENLEVIPNNEHVRMHNLRSHAI